MSNEILFFVVMSIDIAFVMLCFMLGKSYLFVAIISNIMFTNMVSSKIVNIFGLDSTVANVFFAAIIFSSDLSCEHYGKDYAKKAIRLAMLSLVPIILFAPFVNFFQPVIYSKNISDSLNVIFTRTFRISIASVLAFFISNLVDIKIFASIKNKLPAIKWLWLRGNGSSIISIFIDQLLFCILAFAGSVPAISLFQIFISGYLIKVLFCLFDTPFLYLSYNIKNKLNLKDKDESGDN